MMKNHSYPTAAFILLFSVFGILPAAAQETFLLAPDGHPQQHFGQDVAIDGDWAVIGAYFDNDNGEHSGAAYVYHREGDNWVFDTKLLPDDGAPIDNFGRTVDIKGDYIIVGSPQHFIVDTWDGAAYIFHRSQGSWQQQAKLIPSDLAAGNPYYFGYQVAISEAHAAVAPSDWSGTDAVYLFDRAGTSWIESGIVTLPNNNFGNGLGRGLDIEGDRVVAGAFQNNTGTAHFISRSNGVWVLENLPTPPGMDLNEGFGISAAISGDYAIIGAYYPNDGDPWTDATGAAYIFHFNGDSWEQQAELVSSDTYDWFGRDVAIDGDYALVGCPLDGNPNRGAAFLYHRTGDDWTLTQKLTASNGVFADYYGGRVDLSDGNAIMGAPNKDKDVLGYDFGAAYIFGFPVVSSRSQPVADAGADWLFPNPTNGALRVDVPALWGRVTFVEVLNLQGQRLEQVTLDPGPPFPVQLDLSAYPDGMYLVRLRTGEGKTAAAKVVLAKGR